MNKITASKFKMISSLQGGRGKELDQIPIAPARKKNLDRSTLNAPGGKTMLDQTRKAPALQEASNLSGTEYLEQNVLDVDKASMQLGGAGSYDTLYLK